MKKMIKGGMQMFDLAVWKKTFKVIIQSLAMVALASILILVIAAAGQQSVYRNLNIDRNAFADTWEHVWNYGGVQE